MPDRLCGLESCQGVAVEVLRVLPGLLAGKVLAVAQDPIMRRFDAKPQAWRWVEMA